jgi:hypothetical protein
MMEMRTTKSMSLLLVLGLVAVYIAIVYVKPAAKRSLPIVIDIGSLYKIVQSTTWSKSPFHQLASQYRNGCPEHRFTSVRYLSRSPTMLIIEGFLTDLEAKFLVNAA